MSWFKRDKPNESQKPENGEKRVRTEGLWLKCESCGRILFVDNRREPQIETGRPATDSGAQTA